MAINLFVNRLYVITEEGEVAYDEQFHHGVNIIRGANSSGKSTIMHLLFYGLGGDYTHFVPEARRCSRVMVEVSMSGATLTLSRPIMKDDEGRVLTQRGMTIHWGTLTDALEGKCQHISCGYKTTDGTRSFSNVLFDAMGMPIVQGDSNITMHQLLRLLYIDQDSPTSSLFYYEQFDNQTTRETVADLLLGIFDEDLYEAKVRQKTLESDIEDAKLQIRSLELTLPLKMRSSESINQIIDAKRQEIRQLEEEVHSLRQDEEVKKQKTTQTDTLKQEVRRLEKNIAKVEESVDVLKYDIEDTNMFVAELERKHMALTHSADTRQILGTLRLEYCPECLSPLPKYVPQGTCHLCQQPVDNTTGITQAKRLISELTFQRLESEELLRRDEAEMIKAKSRLRKLKAQCRNTRHMLDALLSDVRSSRDEAIEEKKYRMGEINGELLQYYTMLEQVGNYEALLHNRERLEAELVTTKQFIADRLSHQKQRRDAVMRKIQQHGAYFLQHDEERQRAFLQATPEDFSVDFSNNIVFLQHRYAKYSASSSFFLKLVARFSLLLASLDIEKMRFPRFIFADNMEDKGIEMTRAQKFQQTLIDRLRQYDTDSYQVIYTTSYITDALDHSPYVVGEHYTMHNKSLRNV